MSKCELLSPGTVSIAGTVAILFGSPVTDDTMAKEKAGTCGIGHPIPAFSQLSSAKVTLL